jgi:sulfonate transport system substrate-binding protein
MAVQKRRKFMVIAATVLVVVVLFSSFVYLNYHNSLVGNAESITLGVYPSGYDSLIYVANDQQFFSSNGLKITLKDYPSGSAAVNGMLKGETDISTASEFVIVNQAMQNASLYAFGSVSKYLNLFLVARTDKGINSISDLEGKKIGVTIGTGNQFYLGRFLELNGINQSQVALINIPFDQTPNALANGTLDASITFEPYIDQIKILLGNKIIMWPAQSDQFGYFDATCTVSWAAEHPDLVVRFLKALVQAETFSLNHKAEAIAIVAKNLNYTISYTDSDWQNYRYSVTLDQSFVLLMQDEAQWLINNNLTKATSVPNFLNYVYEDGLKLVKPEAVNIIG